MSDWLLFPTAEVEGVGQTFTGIVQDLAEVVSVETADGLCRLELDLAGLTENLQLGASIAVNGTCLTVTRVSQARVAFDVVAETLRTTNLGALAAGDKVNVERSFRVGDEVGGHIVSGHVTATAEVIARTVVGHDHVLRFQIAPVWMKYVFHKGFIALDGASLTVSSVDRAQNAFEISLIPETLARTTLGQVDIGAPVNVEVDAQTLTLVDTVAALMADKEWRAQLGLAEPG